MLKDFLNSDLENLPFKSSCYNTDEEQQLVKIVQTFLHKMFYNK